MNLSKYVRQNPVAVFIALTLGLSFAVFLLPIPKESAFAVIAFLLVPIPTLIAFTLVAVMEGRQGLRTLFGEVFNRRAALKWYVIALALGFAIHFGSSILALVTGRISTIAIAAPTAFFIVYFPLALPEEIGWRGFALPRLLDRHSPFVATLITGIPWALLHFALFLYAAPGASAVGEMLAVLSFALPLTWVYIRSGRNVLVAAVLHGAMNAFAIVGTSIPPAETLWFVVASSCIVGAFLVLIDWRMWFTRRAETTTGHAAPSPI
jgi:uncharacterized protein